MASKIGLSKLVALAVGFVALNNRTGGSHSSDRWLSFVGLVAQSASEYPFDVNFDIPSSAWDVQTNKPVMVSPMIDEYKLLVV